MTNEEMIEKTQFLLNSLLRKEIELLEYIKEEFPGNVSSFPAKKRDDYYFQKGIARGIGRAIYEVETLLETFKKS